MKESLYRQSLQHAWQLTRKHPMLWVFGLFAALLGQMGIMELLSRVYYATQGAGVASGVSFLPVVIQEAASFRHYALSLSGWVWLLWLILILSGLGAALLIAAVASQGALIHATAQSVGKRGKNHLDTNRAWHAGVTHFWRLVGVNAVRCVVLALSAAMVTGAAYGALMDATLPYLLFFLLVFVVATLLALVVSFLTIYAAGYVVIEEYGFFRALQAAWQLFVHHWAVSIEVGLIVLVLNVAMIGLAFFGLLLFFFPAVLIWVLAVALLNYTLFLVGIVLSSILFSAFLLFLGSAFTVFVVSTWTYMFLKMHHEGVKSRVLHWLAWPSK